MRRLAAIVFSIAIFALALVVLHRTIGRFDFQQVVATARAYSPATLVAALLCAMASYVMLSGFDLLALRHAGRRLPPGWTGMVSFVSHAISHNAGFAVLTGGSVRLRMYSAFGLGMVDVAGIVAFAGLTFALGVVMLGAFAFITEGDKVALLLGLPPGLIIGIGWGAACLLVAYGAWAGAMRRPLRVWRWTFATPSLGTTMAQIAVAAADLALVAATLYILLPLDEVIGYPAFAGLYVVATVMGTLSHVPGGLGVFEGALVLMLPELGGATVLAALLVFRVFYNLLPLLLAAILLAAFELIHRRRHTADPEWVRALGPPFTSIAAFVAGAVLLISGAIAVPTQMPSWAAEPAHLLGGGLGGLLIALSWAVLRQAKWAFRTLVAALAAGALLALLRGPDWYTAAILAALLAAVAPGASLFTAPREGTSIPLGWLGAGTAIIAGGVWLTWHGDMGHGDMGHWENVGRLLSFAGDDAARAMRANLVAAVALAAAGLARIRGASG